MNFQPKNRSVRPGSGGTGSSRGFAVVVSLSLMVVQTVLAVGFLSLFDCIADPVGEVVKEVKARKPFLSLADCSRHLLLTPRADGSVHPFVMPEYPPFR